MKCPKHPRYGAKRRPQVPCYPCWVKYVKDNPREKFTAKEMLGMGEAAVEFEDQLLTGQVRTMHVTLGRNSIKSENGLMVLHPIGKKVS